MSKSGKILFGVIALGLLAQTAFAQDKPKAGPGVAEAERPWAKGVAPDQQRIALQMFQEGNALLKENLFKRASDRYAEALSHWDHPAIHYNMALALLNLDKPIEVYQHMEKAMAYGDAPLDLEKFQHAKSYRALIEKELARLEVTCQESGANVTMDGVTLFTAPGKWEGLVRSGKHAIVATKQGYLTTEKTKSLPPGETTKMALLMYTPDDVTRYSHKWAQWKPWVVVAGGAAFVLAGGLFTIEARSQFSDYDAAIKACNGCVPSSDVASKKSTGDTLQTISVVSYAIGGAALVTGAVLVYVNRAHAYRINPVEREPAVTVAPLLGPGVGGAFVSMKF